MVTEIEVTIDSLVVNLDDIGTAATQKNQAISYRTALLRNAYGAARAFAKIWSVRFAAVQKQVEELERTAAQKADLQRLDELDQAMLAMLPLDQLQRRAADSFQTLVGAAETEDPSELARLKTSSEDALRDIEGLVSGVDLDTATALFPQLKQLGDASLGPGGLFVVKESELKATADGRRLIEENRLLANRLSDAVQAFVDHLPPADEIVRYRSGRDTNGRRLGAGRDCPIKSDQFGADCMVLCRPQYRWPPEWPQCRNGRDCSRPA